MLFRRTTVDDCSIVDIEKIFTNNATVSFRENGNNIFCPKCNSNHILVAPLHRKDFFYMLFPFFEGRKLICNNCKTLFK